MGARWTRQQELTLLQGVGVYGVSWLEARVGDSYDWPNAPTGRSAKALYAKARRLYGAGGLTRGAYSLREISQRSGYSVSQLRRAMEVLHQKWKRTRDTRGPYLIYEDQVEELLDWLKGDCWSKRLRLYRCQWCGSTDRPHKGVGLCGRCYARWGKRLRRVGLPTGLAGLIEWVRAELARTGSVVARVALGELERGWACREVVFYDLLEAR